jgi:acetyl esterase/lipase
MWLFWATIDSFAPDLKKGSCIFASDGAISKLPSFCMVGTEEEIIVDEMRIFEKRAKENKVHVETYYVPGNW